MADKALTSKWNNPAFIHALMISFYEQLKGNLTAEVKDTIEKKMHSAGFQDTTWDAIRQHIQKLQRKEQTTGEGSEGGATPTKSTPKKATTPRKRKSPVKAKTEDAGDDDENQKTPTPKRPRASKSTIKDEADAFLKTDQMDGDAFMAADGEM